MIHTLPVIDPGVPGPETLGDRLARLRRLKGFSKTDVAARLGVSITAICHWEQGRSRPRFSRLQALAALLDASPAELVSENAVPRGDQLADLVARKRAEIAHAAGIAPARVRIVIEM